MKENNKVDRKELETLRLSLARIAQMLGVQTISLPVLTRPDLASIEKLAREQDRGWNALAGAVSGRIELIASNNLYATRAILTRAVQWLADNTYSIVDVESALTAVSPIVPRVCRDYYQKAVSELSNGDACIAKFCLELAKKQVEEAIKGFNGNGG
jgi:hypothetical protein